VVSPNKGCRNLKLDRVEEGGVDRLYAGGAKRRGRGLAELEAEEFVQQLVENLVQFAPARGQDVFGFVFWHVCNGGDIFARDLVVHGEVVGGVEEDFGLCSLCPRIRYLRDMSATPARSAK